MRNGGDPYFMWGLAVSSLALILVSLVFMVILSFTLENTTLKIIASIGYSVGAGGIVLMTALVLRTYQRDRTGSTVWRDGDPEVAGVEIYDPGYSDEPPQGPDDVPALFVTLRTPAGCEIAVPLEVVRGLLAKVDRSPGSVHWTPVS